jgi:hypothetical protein
LRIRGIWGTYSALPYFRPEPFWRVTFGTAYISNVIDAILRPKTFNEEENLRENGDFNTLEYGQRKVFGKRSEIPQMLLRKRTPHHAEVVPSRTPL